MIQQTYEWGSLTTEEAAALPDTAIAVLPIGSIEQHGAHLPLATDLIMADRVSAEVCARVGSTYDLWRLPPLAYSKSNEHIGFAGTLTLRTETLLSVLDEIAGSLSTTPVRTLVLINGHGGNTSLLDVAIRDLRIRHGLTTFLVHTLLPAEQGGESHPDELGMGLHGGRDETSLMLHLVPDLVRSDRFVRDVPDELLGYANIGVSGPARMGWITSDISKTGTIGDPTLATTEFGAEQFESMIESISAQMRDISHYTRTTERVARP